MACTLPGARACVALRECPNQAATERADSRKRDKTAANKRHLLPPDRHPVKFQLGHVKAEAEAASRRHVLNACPDK